MKVKQLISATEISARVQEIGYEISESHDGPILLLSVLRGSFCFTADLMRVLPGDVEIGFISASSYEGFHNSEIIFHGSDMNNIEHKSVVIVEDIVDSGRTLDYLLSIISDLKPKSIKICALLNKASRRQQDLYLDYIGFEIGNRFVVGYGLDYDQKYRNLPYIGYVS